ncbi:MAG TPA: hypothetical protein VJ984_02040 [Xanthomonadales bacterium]|nr:hypothetical protein [Xanthomonadales bacterium]
MFARLRSSRSANFVVEIAMIVVGISIALWFESLYEEMQERETEQQYLQGLADDLGNDIKELDDVINDNEKRLEHFMGIIPGLDELGEASSEEQAQTIFAPSSYWFFEPARVTYLSMRESGDFRLLSDPLVKESLLHLMRRYDQIEIRQNNFLQALDDGYIPLMMANFDMIEQQITNPELLENPLFRNFFIYAVQDTTSRVDIMRVSRKEAAELLELVESQL